MRRFFIYIPTSFMFGEGIIFRSVPTALSVIYAAKKYMVKGVDTLALMFISKNINSDNVLLVLQTILVLYDTEQTEEMCSIMEHEARCIIRHCFHHIDKNARTILESDEVEDISLDLLKAIIKRDSLCLPSELCVWQALHRWSHRQCRRRHVSPSTDNKRKVLEGAHYSVRFLTMTCQQFRAASGLLTKEEQESIFSCVLSKDAALIKSIQDYQVGMSTPRQKYGGLWKQILRRKTNSRKMKKGQMTLAEKIFISLVCILD